MEISTKIPVHRDVWLCNETIFRAIRNRLTLPSGIKLNRGVVNRALKSYDGAFDSKNLERFYYDQFKITYPYDASTKRLVTYYYLHVYNERPLPPAAASNVQDIITTSHRARENCEIISSQEKISTNSNKDVQKSTKDLGNENKKEEQSATI